MIRQIVVIAGGKGTRLLPLTENTPKSLIKIKDTPFIDHQLKLFKKNKIDEVVLCLGVFSEKIQKHLGNGSKFGLEIKYSLENPEFPLGTFGSLKKAQRFLNESFFVTWGDSYLDIDFQKIAKSFFETKKLGLMTVLKNQNKLYQNNVSIKDGLVNLYDKQSKNLEYIDYGLSIFNKKVLDFFPEKEKIDMSELNKKLISKNQLAADIVEKKFYEIGSFEGIRELSNEI